MRRIGALKAALNRVIPGFSELDPEDPMAIGMALEALLKLTRVQLALLERVVSSDETRSNYQVDDEPARTRGRSRSE